MLSHWVAEERDRQLQPGQLLDDRLVLFHAVVDVLLPTRIVGLEDWRRGRGRSAAIRARAGCGALFEQLELVGRREA